MSQIGIIYGSTTGNTTKAAEAMRNILGEDRAELIDVAKAGVEDFNRYPNLILGTSTWGYGDLQDDWDGKLALLKEADLKDKTIALFGMGDQQGYASCFLDGMGMIYDTLVAAGVTPVGAWSAEDYSFDASTACQDGTFVGLALDDDNQEEKTAERIATWLQQLDPQWRS